MEKRWNILPSDVERTSSLQKALNIHPVICQVLVQRGIYSFDDAKNYFRPSLSSLHDPWLMKDMDKAVERILRAANAGEKILVFGDYDVDGTTSVACMYQFLKKLQLQVDFYIPLYRVPGSYLQQQNVHHNLSGVPCMHESLHID